MRPLEAKRRLYQLHSSALPLSTVSAPSVMINLISSEVGTQLLADSLVHLHWYEKEAHPVAEIEYLNLIHPDSAALSRSLQQLAMRGYRQNIKAGLCG